MRKLCVLRHHLLLLLVLKIGDILWVVSRIWYMILRWLRRWELLLQLVVVNMLDGRNALMCECGLLRGPRHTVLDRRRLKVVGKVDWAWRLRLVELGRWNIPVLGSKVQVWGDAHRVLGALCCGEVRQSAGGDHGVGRC